MTVGLGLGYSVKAFFFQDLSYIPFSAYLSLS